MHHAAEHGEHELNFSPDRRVSTFRRPAMASSAMPTPGLQLKIEKKAEQTIVHGTGKITSETSALLQSTVRGLIPETKRIVLDLADVEYVDSSGLGALVAVYMAANRAQCDLELTNPKPRIRDLFKITKLSTVFEGHGENYFGGF
jgi:anti-sigma B factor antagonist